MAKEKLQRPKGTEDVSPSRIHIWHQLEALLRETARLYGYRETRFPTFEYTELFVRGVGDTTDVVQKEMYTFEDRGGRSLTLRPEGTASVVRAYLENSEGDGGAPYKVYYIAPNFRAEKPQKGRLRQHHQFGIECFGAAGFEADVEVISAANHYLSRLGLEASLRINSIGCPQCRPGYHKALKAYFEGYRDQLCETCQGRLDKNPLRILDCKSPVCQAIAQDAPKSIDHLCDDCAGHFEGVKRSLGDLGIPFEVDPKIVRGLDYYTKTVFEFVSDKIGAQATVCGGGRYDGLVEELGGKPTSGVGFGSGLERLILAAEAVGYPFAAPRGPDICLTWADEAGRQRILTLAAQLRALGVSAETDLMGRGLKAQMKHADRLGARFTVTLGQSELDQGSVELRNMQTGGKTAAPLEAQAILQAMAAMSSNEGEV